MSSAPNMHERTYAKRTSANPGVQMDAGVACVSAEKPARPVVGRFAPSPSGRMHLGNVYAALMAWLSARSQGGQMLLRIEDLDPRCASPERATQLIDDLHWLGLDWDGKPVYQHDRIELYTTACEELERRGPLYPCFCTRAELHAASAPHASDGTPIYPGTCRNLDADEVERARARRAPAIRLRVPDASDGQGNIAFADRLFGAHTETLATACGDFLVQRSDGVFAYQLVVTVDDALMGVTEVVRGCDLLGSTARQIYLQRLLGYPTPAYAHVPLLVAPDGRRLSKRERDCDLGELKRIFGAPERLLGRLAFATGLIETDTPVSAEKLANSFSWDKLAQRPDSITINEGFFA